MSLPWWAILLICLAAFVVLNLLIFFFLDEGMYELKG